MAEPGVVRRFNVRIPVRAGITLSADLTLPETRPAPAVVVRTPYGQRGVTPEPHPAPVRIFVMGAGEWRDAQAWPPASATSAVFHFSGGGRANSRFGDGRLAPAAVTADEPPDEWTHDPGRPVPFITSASSAQIGGPDDYLGVESPGRRAGVHQRSADGAI
jgi:predicted acyl esterase